MEEFGENSIIWQKMAKIVGKLKTCKKAQHRTVQGFGFSESQHTYWQQQEGAKGISDMQTRVINQKDSCFNAGVHRTTFSARGTLQCISLCG